MPLHLSHYAPGIRELLRTMEAKQLLQLSSTATNNHLMAENAKEAIDIILRYTENLDRFFSYKRITSQVLFEYLHKKKGATSAGKTKQELIERVKKHWKVNDAVKETKAKTKAVLPLETRVVQDRSRVQSTPKPRRDSGATSINVSYTNTTNTIPDITMNLNLSSQEVQFNLEVTRGGGGGGGGGFVRSDVFVRDFCSWFFTMVNRLQPQGARLVGDTFSPDIFMANCSVDIYLYDWKNTEKHASGKNDAYLLMKGICMDYRLLFVPCLESGVRAEMSQHGLLKLFCLGTLQEGNALVGVFEQEFGLVKCPQNKWKIMLTKINLKQTSGCESLPALSQGPVFDIPR